MSELNSKSLFVSAKGGLIDYVSQDGELLLSVLVPPGRVRAREYLELAPPGANIEIAEGIAVVEPRSGYGVQDYGPGSHESAANPDYRPTSASRMEREMRLTLARMQAATNRVEARERALSKIERVPRAPAPDPLIEPEAEPASPAPTPEAPLEASSVE